MSKKILLVDDEPDIIKMLSSRLEANNYEVITALDGKECIDKVTSESPDLIILDVLMPNLTGYEVVQQLRSQGSEIPVIVISARESMKDFFNSWEVNTFVPKPINPDQLISEIENALELDDVDVVISDDEDEIPTEKIGGILVIWVEEYHLKKLQPIFEKKGYNVTGTSDDKDAVPAALETAPDYIFCQYWEDDEVMDTMKVFQSLRQHPNTQNIPFAVFCPSRLALDASKHIEGAEVLPFSGSEQLIKEVEGFMSKAKK